MSADRPVVQPSPSELPSGLDAWRDVFVRFEDVVLVANSDTVDIDGLQSSFGPRTLFVFFNKTYKVLREPFGRPALLVARSSEAGANIVYRREVGKVLAPFDEDRFLGVANLRASRREVFSRREDFGGGPVGFLDLSGAFAGLYPAPHLPTSGFALAAWLAEQRLGVGLHLAGFTARRSGRWKLFADHDWNFEQIVLRLLSQAGRVRLVEDGGRDLALLRLAERFPEIDRSRIALVAADVLGDRLANTDAAVDRLIALTRWQARLRDFFHRLKPPTRKQRMRRAGEGQGSPR